MIKSKLSRLRNVILWMIVLIVVLPIQSSAQHDLDKNTLFLAHFDKSLNAYYAKGNPTSSSSSAKLSDGKFGGGVFLSRASSLTYIGNDGNIDPKQGTVEMWIKPEWNGNDGVSHAIFSFRVNTRNYLNINKLATNRLGIAICGGTKDDWVWRRVDRDISDWKAGKWYHIAGVWGGGKMRFYINGETVGKPVLDAREISGMPETFTLSRCDAAIDELRISNAMRTPDEIKQALTPRRSPRDYLYLSELTPVESKQSFGFIGSDCRLNADGTKMPIVMGGMIYGKGIATSGNATIVYDLNGIYDRFTSAIGLDDVAGVKGSVRFQVFGDGKIIFDSGLVTRSAKPKQINVSVRSVKRLKLVVSDAGDGEIDDLADWGAALVLRQNVETPPSFVRKITKQRIELLRKLQRANEYTFNMPKSPKGYWVYAKNYLDDIDPNLPPEEKDKEAKLSTFATPGEYEPLCFVIYAQKNLENIKISVDKIGAIPPTNIDVRIVRRCLQRKMYFSPPEQCEIVSRFLEETKPVSIPAQNFREVLLTIKVPNNLNPGLYKGHVSITPKNSPPTEIPLVIEILPFKLHDIERKRYSLYYRLRLDPGRAERTDLELKDIREHGATTLFPGIGIEYRKEKGGVKVSYDSIRKGLTIMKEHGYRGVVPIGTGLITLGRVLGHKDLGYSGETGESLDGDKAFWETAKKAIEGLAQIKEEFPEFDIVLTHMDEVFNRNRLPLYIRLTRAAQQVPGFRFHQTLHTSTRSNFREKMAQIDPYVDIRCYNGHVMDDWLREGHTFDELAQELKESGDEAWIYYNLRGAFVTPEWVRIINGFYMWLGPFKMHCPWIYHSYSGNPFDDTDGPRRGCDYGFAFPSLEDGITPVPTRHWEAFREGVDDVKYLCTLEDVIASVKKYNPAKTKEAETWLNSLRIDIFPNNLSEIKGESPVLIAISRRLKGEDYQRIRYQVAQHIIKLMAK